MTMPFDNVKTRMQALGAETRYANSLDCFTKVSRKVSLLRRTCRLPCISFVDHSRRRNLEALGRYDAKTGAIDGEADRQLADLVYTGADMTTDRQLSGGIVFTVYGKVVELSGRL